MHVILCSTPYIHCSLADKSNEAGVDKKRQRQSSGEAWLLDMDAKMKGMCHAYTWSCEPDLAPRTVDLARETNTPH